MKFCKKRAKLAHLYFIHNSDNSLALSAIGRMKSSDLHCRSAIDLELEVAADDSFEVAIDNARKSFGYFDCWTLSSGYFEVFDSLNVGHQRI